MLTQAIENIDRYFSFVGLSEHFDESLIRMRAALGWRKPLLYVVSNRNKKRPTTDMIPDETIAIIKRQNELDCRLYDHVKSQFEGTRSASVIRETRRFKRINLLYRLLR